MDHQRPLRTWEPVGRRKDEKDEHLPTVGEVYVAHTIVFANGDHAEDRPVVVVRAPQHRTDYVTVIQRTSSCFHLPGVDHAKSDALGLERDGRWIFDYQRALRADQFTKYSFELRGALSPAEVQELLEAWEAQP
jgi:hypothetical protein